MEQNLEIKQQTKGLELFLKIEDAIQHPLKIGTALENDILNALVFTFALIGLPDTSIPKGLTKSFLIDFIRNNYRFYSVEEIKTAFVLLVKGDYSDKKPNHYNNFSPEYFGSVMALYKSHREKAFLVLHSASNKPKAEIPYIPTGIEKTKIQIEFDRTVINPIFEKYKQFKVIELITTPAKLVYDSLSVYHKIIEFSIEEKKAIIAQAKAKYGNRWTDVFKGIHSGLDWQALKFQLK